MNEDEKFPDLLIPVDQAWEAMRRQLDAQTTEPLAAKRNPGNPKGIGRYGRFATRSVAAAGLIGLIGWVLMLRQHIDAPIKTRAITNAASSPSEIANPDISILEIIKQGTTDTEATNQPDLKSAIIQGTMPIMETEEQGEKKMVSNSEIQKSENSETTTRNNKEGRWEKSRAQTQGPANSTKHKKGKSSLVAEGIKRSQPDETETLEKAIQLSTPRLLEMKKIAGIYEGFDAPDASMVSPGLISASRRARHHKGFQFGLDFGLTLPLQGTDYYLRNSRGNTALYQPLVPRPWIGYELAPNQRLRIHINPWQNYQAGKALIDTSIIQQSPTDTLARLKETRLINSRSLQLGIQYQYNFARNWTAGVGIGWNKQRKALFLQQETQIWNNKSLGDSLFSANKEQAIWQQLNQRYFTGSLELSYQLKQFQLGASISKPISSPVSTGAAKQTSAELLIRWRWR